jgi:hypothetical protein
MKNCSTSLFIKEMQIKSTLHFISTQLGCPYSGVIIANDGKDAAKQESLWKAVWRFLEKVKIELPYDVVIPLLGIYPKEQN